MAAIRLLSSGSTISTRISWLVTASRKCAIMLEQVKAQDCYPAADRAGRAAQADHLTRR